MLGRPWPQPGEPLFTEEDSRYVLALAEEERDTCPSCGMPKAWCRDPANQFAFEPAEEDCHASRRLAQFRLSEKWTDRSEDAKAAAQVAVRFRDGHAPQMDAGLELGDVEVD